MGQFLLTGSAVPADKRKISHSGTGRFAWLAMRPMSLYESGDSTGEVSIGKLFESDDAVETLTATENYAYRRETGIFVVPLGCLKD